MLKCGNECSTNSTRGSLSLILETKQARLVILFEVRSHRWCFMVRSCTLHYLLAFQGAFLDSALPLGVSSFQVRSHRWCFILDDKMSEVALDFVTKIKSRHISFLQCMHGKETSTHEMRNCWAGDDAGYQNLRMIKSASKKPNTDN